MHLKREAKLLNVIGYTTDMQIAALHLYIIQYVCIELRKSGGHKYDFFPLLLDKFL